MCSSPSTKPTDSGDNELSIYPDHAGRVLLRDIPLNARPPNRAYHRMPTSAPTARKHLSRSRQGTYRDGFPLFRPETPSSSPVGSRLFHIRTGGQQCEKPSLRTIRFPPRYWSPSLPARNRIYPVSMLHRRNGQLRTDRSRPPRCPTDYLFQKQHLHGYRPRSRDKRFVVFLRFRPVRSRKRRDVMNGWRHIATVRSPLRAARPEDSTRIRSATSARYVQSGQSSAQKVSCRQPAGKEPKRRKRLIR